MAIALPGGRRVVVPSGDNRLWTGYPRGDAPLAVVGSAAFVTPGAQFNMTGITGGGPLTVTGTAAFRPPGLVLDAEGTATPAGAKFPAHTGIPTGAYAINDRNDAFNLFPQWSARFDMLVLQGPSPRDYNEDKQAIIDGIANIHAQLPGSADWLRIGTYINLHEANWGASAGPSNFSDFKDELVAETPAWALRDADGNYIMGNFGPFTRIVNRAIQFMPDNAAGKDWFQAYADEHARILTDSDNAGARTTNDLISFVFQDIGHVMLPRCFRPDYVGTITEVLSTTSCRVSPVPTFAFDSTSEGAVIFIDSYYGQNKPIVSTDTGTGVVVFGSAPATPLAIGQTVAMYDGGQDNVDVNMDGVNEPRFPTAGEMHIHGVLLGQTSLANAYNSAEALKHPFIIFHNGGGWGTELAGNPDQPVVAWDNEWVGAGTDWALLEWCNRNAGFRVDENGFSYYNSQNNRGFDTLLLHTLTGLRLFRPPAENPFVTPIYWLGWDCSANKTATPADISTWTPTDKMWMRTAAAISMLVDNTGIVITREGDHGSPAWADEFCIDAGSRVSATSLNARATLVPPPDTSQPSGPAQIVMPPADFGTGFCYQRETERTFVAANLNKPPINTEWQLGQGVQVCNVPDAGEGFVWANYDCTSHSGRDGIPMMGQDPTVNNGAILGRTGVQLSLGYWESRFLERIVDTGNPPGPDPFGTTETIFSYTGLTTRVGRGNEDWDPPLKVIGITATYTPNALGTEQRLLNRFPVRLSVRPDGHVTWGYQNNQPDYDVLVVSPSPLNVGVPNTIQAVRTLDQWVLTVNGEEVGANAWNPGAKRTVVWSSLPEKAHGATFVGGASLTTLLINGTLDLELWQLAASADAGYGVGVAFSPQTWLDDSYFNVGEKWLGYYHMVGDATILEPGSIPGQAGRCIQLRAAQPMTDTVQNKDENRIRPDADVYGAHRFIGCRVYIDPAWNADPLAETSGSQWSNCLTVGTPGTGTTEYTIGWRREPNTPAGEIEFWVQHLGRHEIGDTAGQVPNTWSPQQPTSGSSFRYYQSRLKLGQWYTFIVEAVTHNEGLVRVWVRDEVTDIETLVYEYSGPNCFRGPDAPTPEAQRTTTRTTGCLIEFENYRGGVGIGPATDLRWYCNQMRIGATKAAVDPANYMP